jgi:putative ABC transport system ATP-binding protein
MNIINLSGISKIYKLGEISLKALDNISVSVEKGEFVAIMGPSGSGKSTFMNIVGCLDKPTTGSYMLEGREIGNLDSDTLSEIRNKNLGFVFQGFNLLSRTSAMENVELPMLYAGVHLAERRRRAAVALKSVGLEGREKHYSNQLSGGQQQRVAIARAIVNNVSILLADEPTGNLDTHTSEEIMELFVKLNRDEGITIILVTHEEDIAEYSKRILRFVDGKIVSDKQRGDK